MHYLMTGLALIFLIFPAVAGEGYIKESSQSRDLPKEAIKASAHCYHILMDFPQGINIYALDPTDSRLFDESIVPQLQELYINRKESMSAQIKTKLKDKETFCTIDFDDIDRFLKAPTIAPTQSSPKAREFFRAIYKSTLPDPKKLPEDLLPHAQFPMTCKKATPWSIKEAVDISKQPADVQQAIYRKLKETIPNPKNIAMLPQDITLNLHYNNEDYKCLISAAEMRALRALHILGPVKEVLDQESKENDNLLLSQSSSHLGDLVFVPNAMTTAMFDSIAPNMSVLEIGAARGIDTFKMLQRGARVTAVDIGKKDIKKLQKNTPKSLSSQLETIVGDFPDQLNLNIKTDNDKFDIVYMSHVAHYLEGDKVRRAIEKIGSLIKPNTGTFYFQALTPYSNPYVWNMKTADEKALNNHEWPGSFSENDKMNEAKKRPKAVRVYFGRGMPDNGHPIHPAILERELVDNGFTVLAIGYLPISKGIAEIVGPLTYQEHEMYVKRLVHHIDRTDLERIEKKIDDFDKSLATQKKLKMIYPEETPNRTYKDLLDEDAERYVSNYNDLQKKSFPLVTMATVYAIACKGCEAPKITP